MDCTPELAVSIVQLFLTAVDLLTGSFVADVSHNLTSFLTAGYGISLVFWIVELVLTIGMGAEEKNCCGYNFQKGEDRRNVIYWCFLFGFIFDECLLSLARWNVPPGTKAPTKHGSYVITLVVSFIQLVVICCHQDKIGSTKLYWLCIAAGIITVIFSGYNAHNY